MIMSKQFKKDAWVKTRTRQQYYVKAWDAEVTIQALTAAKFEELASKRFKLKKGGAQVVNCNYEASLVAASVVDPDSGQLLFTVGELAGEAQFIVSDIAKAVMKLNGIEEDEEKNASPSDETTGGD